MHLRIAEELQGGIRRFQAVVHPDRFLRHPAEVAARNAEAFKIVGSVGASLCSSLRRGGGGGDGSFERRFIFAPRRLEFHLSVPPPSPLLSHTLPFDGREVVKSNDDHQPAISWQEAALSVLHLLTKAHVEHDQRITRWLLATHNADSTESDEASFLSEKEEAFPHLLLQHQQIANDSASLQRTMQDLDNVRLSRDLSPEAVRVALRSVWECRDIFCKLQQMRPGTCFVITDQLAAWGRDSSPRTICLTIHFSPRDLSRYLSF